MPEAGNSYVVELKQTHLSWGTHRATNSRDRITGEHFIPIPKSAAESFRIYNKVNGSGIGKNQYYAKSADGFYSGIVKISGSSTAGDPYGKNIAESGNLKGFQNWFLAMGVTVGTKIRVEWISNDEILFSII